MGEPTGLANIGASDLVKIEDMTPEQVEAAKLDAHRRYTELMARHRRSRGNGQRFNAVLDELVAGQRATRTSWGDKSIRIQLPAGHIFPELKPGEERVYQLVDVVPYLLVTEEGEEEQKFYPHSGDITGGDWEVIQEETA